MTNYRDAYHLKQVVDSGEPVECPFTVFNSTLVFNSLSEYTLFLQEAYSIDFYTLTIPTTN